MDNERIAELFAGLGPVSIRRLFGGKGIYFDGVIVAIVLRGELMLKADEQSAPDFEAAGCKQWTYTGSRHGKLVAMPYWSIPDERVRRSRRDEGALLGAAKAYEAGRCGARRGK